MKSGTKFLKETTVSNYSSRNSSVYDDPMNKNFVYGKLTIDFVNKINFQKEDKIIVDVGCGTGFGFEIIYEKLKKDKKKCIGIEPAKGMLELAKSKFKLDPSFSFYEGTFAKIPLEDKSVDKIISTLALHWVPSLDDSIKELKRISRPGLREYVNNKNIPTVKGGLGISVISTSKGLMTDKEAKQAGIGGEVICLVF